MNKQEFDQFCKLDDQGVQLLKKAMESMGLSARAYDRILKVARTIADLECSDLIESHHLAEAIQFRSLDRSNWLSN
jgi:magnesium chelatase family protein